MEHWQYAIGGDLLRFCVGGVFDVFCTEKKSATRKKIVIFLFITCFFIPLWLILERIFLIEINSMDDVKVHKLKTISADEEFELIAIHTSLSDYRLVYFLNKVLKISLIRNHKKYITNGESMRNNYAYYHCTDGVSSLEWHCIANRVHFEDRLDPNSIFSTTTSIDYLINKLKKVDFFLKINTEEGSFNTEETLKKINQIPYIAKAYAINVTKLSSQHKLIFQEC